MIQTRSPEETSNKQLIDAIKLFQSYFNLNLTGKLDDQTLELMSRPRCGNPDILNDDHISAMRSHDEKRKIFNGNFPSGKWSIRHITYRITNYQPNYAQNIPYKVNISGVIETRYYNVSYDLTHQQVREIIKRALDQWASVTELTFEEVSPNQEANIEFLFSFGQHGCGWSFDGPSNVLAHAFFPTSDQQGDVHFDYESWGEDPSQSVDLLVTTVHEFGHTLGLSHKEKPWDATMAPLYNWNWKQLHRTDIERVQILYGVNKNNPKKIFIPRFVSDQSIDRYAICNDSKFDAISYSFNGTIYVFKGLHVWEFNIDFRQTSNSPRQIIWNWKSVNQTVDAAVLFNKELYLFSGKYVWIFNQTNEEEYFKPKKISKIFPGIKGSVKSAFTSKDNQNIYLTNETQFWMFDKKKKLMQQGIVDQKWDISSDQIHSGITFNNGITYLFQSDYYYKLNETVWVKSSPEYPRQTITLWFECRSRKKIIGNMTLRTKRPKTDAVTLNSTKPAPQHHQSNDDDGDEHPLLDIFTIFCVLLFTCEIGLVVTVYIWDEKTTKKDFNLNRIEKT